MSEKEDSHKKLGEMLKELAKRQKERSKLKPQSHVPTIKELCDDGDQILNKEEKKSPKSKTEDKKSFEATNPYFIARLMVLKRYNDWRKREIATMESTGDIDNRFYNDFVHEVAEEGDKLTK